MASVTKSVVHSRTASDSVDPSQDTEQAMAELRRVQLANEGMRLLLNSEVKKAEELFKGSRYG